MQTQVRSAGFKAVVSLPVSGLLAGHAAEPFGGGFLSNRRRIPFDTSEGSRT